MPITPDYLKKAREEGFSDEEIYSYEATQDPFYAKAKEEGFSLDELALFNAQSYDPRTGEDEASVAQQDQPDQPAMDLVKRFYAETAKAGATAAAGLTEFAEYNPLVAVSRKFIPGVEETQEEAQQFQRDVAGRAKEDYGVDETYDQTFGSQVMSGVGSLVPVFAAGPAGTLATAGVAGGLAGESARAEAEAKGATEAQQNVNFLLNAATGYVSEKILGVPKLLASAKALNVPMEALKGTVGNVVKGIAKAIGEKASKIGTQAILSAGREGVQEMLEEIASDTIAKYSYDPERDLFDLKKLATVGAVGAVIGAPTGAVTQAAEIADALNPSPEKIAQIRESGLPLTAQVLETETKGGETDEQNETQRVPDPAGTLQAGDAQRETERGGEILRPDGVQVPESPLSTDSESSGGTEVQDRERLTTEGGVQTPAPVPSNEVPQQQESQTPQEPPKVLTPDERAKTLQPFVKEAERVAESMGATDPEQAASKAWSDLSKSDLPLDNPRSLLLKFATGNAKDQLKASQAKSRGAGNVVSMEGQDIENAAVETEGPRAEALQKEDMEQLRKAIETFNPTEKRVGLMLADDMTVEEISEELDMAVGSVKNIRTRLAKELGPYAERMGIGKSLGPGAASAAEVLVQYEIRRFSERFQESKDIDETVREQTGNRYYEPIPNRITAENARSFIEGKDSETILDQIMDEQETTSFADRATVGQVLIKRLNKEYQEAKETNPEEAEKILDRAIKASEWLADYGTRLGQGVQSFAMWNALTPEGKLVAVQRAVKKQKKRFIKDNQKDVDEVLDILNEDTSAEVKRSKLSKSKSKTAKAAKKNLKKIPKKPNADTLLDTIGADLGLATLTPEQQAEIMRLAEIAENAPDGMPKEDALNELNSYIAHIKGFQWFDLPLGIYYGNILSGSATQLVNLVDTALNVVSEVAGSAAVGQDGQRSIRDAFGMLHGLARGLDSGRWDALLAITKGRRISDGKFVENPYLMDVARFGEKGGVPIQQTGKIASLVKKAAESRGAKYLKGYKYVGRAMAASDALAFRSAQEARAAQLSFWMAHDSGLKGKDLKAEVDRILGFDRKEEFLAQAEAEGYSGVQAKARATELMLQSRPEGLQKEATDFASESTYNYKPYGVLGSVSNAIESLSRKYPALKLIVPFTRIVANVTNRGLNYTPWGAARAWRGKSGDKVFTEREQQVLQARAIIGTTAIITLGAMNALGLITLHGKGPDDEEKRKQLRESGWKPYTIQIGDDYYTYTYTPIGLGLAALSNFFEAKRYGSMDDKDSITALTYAMQSIGSTLLNQSFLSSLSSFFEMLSNRGSQGVSAFKRLVTSTTSGMAVPFASAVKDINQLFDPKVRKPENIQEALISEIPVIRTAVKPALNAFGEPIEKDPLRLRERFMSSNKEGPWKIVRETGLRVPTTDPFFENPDEDYEYAQKTGQRIKEFIVKNEDLLRSLPKLAAQDSLVNYANRVKKEVRGEMLYRGSKKKPKK